MITSWFLIPTLGLALGKYSFDATPGSTNTLPAVTGSLIGAEAAARGGLVMDAIQGADFRFGLWMTGGLGSQSPDQSAQNSGYTRWSAGPMVATRLKEIPLEIAFSFSPWDRYSTSVSTVTQTYSGTNLQLGVGYFVADLFSIPQVEFILNFQRHSYSEVEQSGRVTKYPIQSTGSSLQEGPVHSVVVLGVGIPLDGAL